MGKNMQVCIYCQANPKETNDHVPPKGLFREPRPSNLITVPACLSCNNGFSGDDDYFLNLALEWAASESGDGRGVAEKRLRSMKRKAGRNVWKSIFAKVKAVEVYSPGGLYLANSLEFSLDTGRLIRCVNRMIRGFFFEFTKTPLPVGDYTRAMPFSQYVEKHKDEPQAVEFIQFIPHLQGRVIGEGTFEVRYFVLDPDRHSSFWYLEFYRRFAFVGVTGAAAASPGEGDSERPVETHGVQTTGGETSQSKQ
jgi:hypothetical protein